VNDPTAAAAFEALLSRRGGDLLILVDDALRILSAGPGAAALAERPIETLAGMSLIAAFGSASLDAVARQATSSDEATSGEADLGHLGGRHFVVDAVPLGAGGIVLFLHDVTGLRRMERVRRDFVANISHELRTPLTAIKLLAETLTSGAVDDPATTKDFATQIEREVDHLAQLVDELLDLSTIESGATTLSIEALDPDTVVAACDPARLSQALLNLAHNAVKYSHHGGEVRIGWDATDERVRFIVSDDGIGIPDAHQARIFERFYKVDRSRARDQDVEQLGGSAGLGLAIVRHIAEAHRGSVGVSSEEGVGSTFWIEVPRAGD
jgi:two-component system phosphate regulon sensor histidine kinase PhoR